MLVLLRMHVRPVINQFFPTRITGPGLGRAEVTKHVTEGDKKKSSFPLKNLRREA